MTESVSKRKIIRVSGGALIAILVLIISFNVNYFFIARDVGPGFYFKRIFEEPKDRILQDATYQDFVKEYENLNRMFADSKSIVFLGDSITARFKVGEYFGYHPVLNRGIYSDTTVGLMNRIERNCNNLNIYKCFIMIGYNDLKYRRDEEIAKNYEKIVKALKADNIYVLSILPVGRKFEKHARRIPGLNLRLREIAERNGRVYVDVYEKLVGESGFIKSEFTSDGVHPNGNGYAKIAKVVRNYAD